MTKWLNTYHHQFSVPASLDRVVEFHRRAASMAAITPPPVRVKIHHAPEVLADGDRMDFTMWFGPLPVHWEAQIEAVSSGGFTDRQVRGPFGEWVHTHNFIAIHKHTTTVHDEVHLRLRRHPYWWFVGLGMRLGLPFLFAFRAWKTRRMIGGID
jgi:ligand-binding SRPBCC domain-containing protein